MDLSIITSLPALAPYAAYIAAVFGVAAVVAKYLPPPSVSGSTLYATLYGLVNLLAQNSGHAANAVTVAKDTAPHA